MTNTSILDDIKHMAEMSSPSGSVSIVSTPAGSLARLPTHESQQITRAALPGRATRNGVWCARSLKFGVGPRWSCHSCVM